nr:auxilin-like protein [Tanacetum cinerariifolium]GEW95399.1 auxilin-like protein [Tanacetum cinerariifolium]
MERDTLRYEIAKRECDSRGPQNSVRGEMGSFRRYTSSISFKAVTGKSEHLPFLSFKPVTGKSEHFQGTQVLTVVNRNAEIGDPGRDRTAFRNQKSGIHPLDFSTNYGKMRIYCWDVEKVEKFCRLLMFGFIWGSRVHCKELPSFKYRHDMIRDVLFDICRGAGISVKKEAPMNFLTDPSDGRSTLRPADILVFRWAGEKHVCVDLTGFLLLWG